MEMRLGRESNTKGSKTMQRRHANTRPKRPQHAPDLTDFMNDVFFGTANTEKKAYNLTGEDVKYEEEKEEEPFEQSNRSSRNSRLTEEWLDEARRLVASSPSRCNSPSRLVGSPRFAVADERSSASLLDRRDPLSRSARRHRAVDSFSGEILSKVVNHSRNKSESFSTSSATSEQQIYPASAVQKWISNILKPSNPTISNPLPNSEPSVTILAPRKSRFHTDPSSPRLQIPSSRTFNNSSSASDALLSPPKSLIESAQTTTLSSPTCSSEKILPKSNINGFVKADDGYQELGLNEFLKEQRRKIQKIWNGELNAKAKIIISGPSNSTSSMVAAVCYAWLLENKMRRNKAENGRECLVVPVMNMKRGKMWNQRQVAWLFYHLGLDATSILFTDEVDLESLMMAGQISVLVVGQDILKMSDGVGSQCTILTDNYCEDAYHLLQTPLLKNLLLAGILLDTQNLDSSAQSSMTRDVEAVQLLSVGSIPNYRNGLYDQLMQDQKDGPFLDALQRNYGKPPNDGTLEQHVSNRLVIGSNNGEVHAELITERNLRSISPHDDSLNQQKKYNDFRSAKTHRVSPKFVKPSALPIQTPTREASNASRGKNKFFLAKWFGFGSK